MSPKVPVIVLALSTLTFIPEMRARGWSARAAEDKSCSRYAEDAIRREATVLPSTRDGFAQEHSAAQWAEILKCLCRGESSDPPLCKVPVVSRNAPPQSSKELCKIEIDEHDLHEGKIYALLFKRHDNRAISDAAIPENGWAGGQCLTGARQCAVWADGWFPNNNESLFGARLEVLRGQQELLRKFAARNRNYAGYCGEALQAHPGTWPQRIGVESRHPGINHASSGKPWDPRLWLAAGGMLRFEEDRIKRAIGNMEFILNPPPN